jgi:hypothetical protein
MLSFEAGRALASPAVTTDETGGTRMRSDDPWQSRKWMANLIGILMGLATLGTIAYIGAAKAQVVPPASGGFFIVGSYR